MKYIKMMGLTVACFLSTMSLFGTEIVNAPIITDARTLQWKLERYRNKIDSLEQQQINERKSARANLAWCGMLGIIAGATAVYVLWQIESTLQAHEKFLRKCTPIG